MGGCRVKLLPRCVGLKRSSDRGTQRHLLPRKREIQVGPRKSGKPPQGGGVLQGPQRLNRVLAAAGLGSRRQVEELIEQGRIEIDGKICVEFHRRVDPITSTIRVDGEVLRQQRPTYLMLNKPAGVLCTNRDPEGRIRAIDLVPDGSRLFPVGRLDRSSKGLLLLTNDGELAQQLTHPKYGVPKTYFVVVQGQLDPAQLLRLRKGIYLSEGVARVEGARIRAIRKGTTELEMTLTEGKNREIRRVLARVGNKVLLLRRVAIGPLRLADLPEGAHRPLIASEVAALYAAVERARQERKDAKKGSRQGSNELAQNEASSETGETTRSPRTRPNKPQATSTGRSAPRRPVASTPPRTRRPAPPVESDIEAEGMPQRVEVSPIVPASSSTASKRGSVLGYQEGSEPSPRRPRSSEPKRQGRFPGRLKEADLETEGLDFDNAREAPGDTPKRSRPMRTGSMRTGSTRPGQGRSQGRAPLGGTRGKPTQRLTSDRPKNARPLRPKSASQPDAELREGERKPTRGKGPPKRMFKGRPASGAAGNSGGKPQFGKKRSTGRPKSKPPGRTGLKGKRTGRPSPKGRP